MSAPASTPQLFLPRAAPLSGCAVPALRAATVLSGRVRRLRVGVGPRSRLKVMVRASSARRP
eukprot:1299138-Rhodomonas_salina.1